MIDGEPILWRGNLSERWKCYRCVSCCCLACWLPASFGALTCIAYAWMSVMMFQMSHKIGRETSAIERSCFELRTVFPSHTLPWFLQASPSLAPWLI